MDSARPLVLGMRAFVGGGKPKQKAAGVRHTGFVSIITGQKLKESKFYVTEHGKKKKKTIKIAAITKSREISLIL